MQYGLYRLAWRGWVRLSATQNSTMHENQILPARTSLRSNQGWVRRYEFFSGLPVWMDSEGNQSFRHPDYPNAHRDFRWTSQQAGVWAWYNGIHWIKDDTENCFIHSYSPLVQRPL
jgi:hypothetical protein